MDTNLHPVRVRLEWTTPDDFVTALTGGSTWTFTVVHALTYRAEAFGV